MRAVPAKIPDACLSRLADRIEWPPGFLGTPAVRYVGPVLKHAPSGLVRLLQCGGFTRAEPLDFLDRTALSLLENLPDFVIVTAGGG